VHTTDDEHAVIRKLRGVVKQLENKNRVVEAQVQAALERGLTEA